MGTSTNYKAPTFPQWGNLKGKVTRLVHQETPDAADIDTPETPNAADINTPETPDTTNTDIPEIVTDFVKVNYGSSEGTGSGGGGSRRGGSGGGGSRRGSTGSPGATARRRAAQNIAQNIGGFFSSVANLGFREAFEQAGLGLLEGKSVREIAYSLLDYLGGPSSTLDQVDARKALTDLMSEIFQDVHSPEDVEEAMERRSDGESFADMIRSFFGHYINAQFVRAFYERVTARRPGTQIFGKIRNFICAAVKFEVRHQDVTKINWSGNQGQQIVANIFEKTLEVFGV